MEKKMHKLTTLTVTIALGFALPAAADTLRISVETPSNKGDIFAAVYASPEAYENDVLSIGISGPAKLGVTELEIQGLEPGIYGIALFQDLNGNGELNTNLFGIPTEPYGFSNNPTIGFSAPKFEEIKFEFDGTAKELKIKMNGS